jgi:hypothetical protein
MAEGRLRAEWAQTSEVLALIANANRDPKKSRRVYASDFNPFAERRRSSGSIRLAPTVENMKAVFFGGQTPLVRQECGR